MDQYKTCTKCGQLKPMDNFGIHRGKKSSKSGRRAECKSCQLLSNRIYREKNRDLVNSRKREYDNKNKDKKAFSDKKYREANKDKISKRTKQWRIRNLEIVREKQKLWREANKEKKSATDRAWSQANKDAVNRASKKWRELHPEKAKNVSKAYRQLHPEAQKIKAAQRRATLRDNGVFLVTKKDWNKILEKGCTYCGLEAEHVDHIIPISRGGRHSIGNLTGACARCNLSKGAKFITEWKKGNDGYRKSCKGNA